MNQERVPAGLTMSRLSRRAAATILFAILVGCVATSERPSPGPARWITAWTTSQSALGTTGVTNATVRMIARVTISGEGVRLRFDNTYGTAPVVFGKVYVGHRVQKEILAAGSNRQVFFDRAGTTTIAAGSSVESDPVPMTVIAGEDLAVSVYIPDADVRPSQHTAAMVTSYLSENGSGNVAADEVKPTPGFFVAPQSPFKRTTTSMFWLKGVDVLSSSSTGAIVVLGDSITDGSCSTVDAHDRWEDRLAVRLDLAGIRKAVLNAGIAGNTITREGLHPPVDTLPALERLDRDVLSNRGVTHVFLFEGTNDIRRDAPAAQVIGGTQELVKRIKARGIKIIAATIIPRHDLAPFGTNTGWDAAKTAIRHQVNDWLRSKSPFDGIVDFDKAMRDPANPEVNYPSFHCDGIHPNVRGYYELAKAVPLEMLK
jgi:lysophospholipase L1-like esterase